MDCKLRAVYVLKKTKTQQLTVALKFQQTQPEQLFEIVVACVLIFLRFLLVLVGILSSFPFHSF